MHAKSVLVWTISRMRMRLMVQFGQVWVQCLTQDEQKVKTQVKHESVIDEIGNVQPSPGKLKRGTRQRMQQHHLLLMHAYKCQQRESRSRTTGEPWQCRLARCQKLKKVLNHMISCPLEKECLCSPSRQLMKRLTNCKLEDCPVCVQRKRWQISVTAEQRSHAVDLLIQASSPAFLCYGREISQKELLFLNKTLESDMYKTANTSTEYYRMLAATKWDIEMIMEEKRTVYYQNSFIKLGTKDQIMENLRTLNPPL